MKTVLILEFFAEIISPLRISYQIYAFLKTPNTIARLIVVKKMKKTREKMI